MSGMHLIVDAYGCRSELLRSAKALEKWINSLPEDIGMSVLIPARVVCVAPPLCEQGDEGLTGVVVIVTSHVSVHTYPSRRAAYVDVFSCREFDPRYVLDRILRDFDAQGHDCTLVERMKRAN